MGFQVGLEKDVSGIDLRGEDLRRSYWYEKNVSYAYLVKVRFEDSYLKGCNFESTYLLGANFAGAHLGGVNFTSARLGGADFRGADLTGAKLFGAIIKSDRDPLKPHEGFTGGVDFAEADLYRTNVKGANLTAVVGIEVAVNLDKLVWDDLTIWPGGGPPAGLGPPTPG